MYKLPPELEAKIWAAIAEGRDAAEPDSEQAIFNAIAKLYVRENRRLRQQIAGISREMASFADDAESNYDDAVMYDVGASTCEYININIIKPNVYFNSEESEARKNAVEKFIEDFYGQD